MARNANLASERVRSFVRFHAVLVEFTDPRLVVAYDTLFYDLLPKLFPARDMRTGFANNAELAQDTAFRNGSLQGAYLIIAARALGLDCGPMSGFDNARVDADFFADGRWKSNFLCNLGYGDHTKVHPRNPRPSFEEACRIL